MPEPPRGRSARSKAVQGGPKADQGLSPSGTRGRQTGTGGRAVRPPLTPASAVLATCRRPRGRAVGVVLTKPPLPADQHPATSSTMEAIQILTATFRFGSSAYAGRMIPTIPHVIRNQIITLGQSPFLFLPPPWERLLLRDSDRVRTCGQRTTSARPRFTPGRSASRMLSIRVSGASADPSAKKPRKQRWGPPPSGSGIDPSPRRSLAVPRTEEHLPLGPQRPSPDQRSAAEWWGADLL